ncbi:hypothetical protein ACFZAU_11630 [Streptomyces sp. NPDC008238]
MLQSKFKLHANLVCTALVALEEEPARFTGKTATGRAQQEEGERNRTDYAEPAISAEYNLRRDTRDKGVTSPDLPPALGDVDLPQTDANTTPEEGLEGPAA